jgi:hypothetical protein
MSSSTCDSNPKSIHRSKEQTAPSLTTVGSGNFDPHRLKGSVSERLRWKRYLPCLDNPQAKEI